MRPRMVKGFLLRSLPGALGAMVLFGGNSHTLGQPPKDKPQETDCGRCHVQSAPAPGSAELRPCSRPSVEPAKPMDRLRGPSVVILNELENVYLPVPFDHAGHATMAQMSGGCVTCHHHSPGDSEHPACKTCHEAGAKNNDIAKPGLKGAYHRQCISCHREWSGESGCNACHQPKTASLGVARAESPTPDDVMGRMHPPIPEPEEEVYTTAYPEGGKTKVLFRHREHIHRYHLRCADCHRDDNCSRCHSQGKNHVQKVRTVEEHHKPCMACHQRDTCESCHFGETATPPPPFDHASTGWTLKAYHADRSCRLCHSTLPFERMDSSCNSCHREWNAGNFNHAVTGQALDENHARHDCTSCHKENAFGKAPSCDDCHDESEGISFPQKRPGPQVRNKGVQQ